MKYNWRKTDFLNLIWLAILAISYSCAQIVAPSGGEKDITSPKILNYNPANYSHNFNSQCINLTFDEYIQVKNWNQVIVSPPLNDQLEYKLKGKKLEINWKDSLLLNTTYSINFGNSIVDNNEGNVLDSNIFVFSTGNHLDSLILKGNVIKSYEQKSEKNITVMLFNEKADLNKFEKKPIYYTKTNDKGEFIINHIKAGKYQLIALKDNNQNFKYEPEEAIAFSDSAIHINQNTQQALFLFEQAAEKTFVKKTAAEGKNKLSVILNRASDSINYEPLSSNLKKTEIILEENKTKDSLTFWLINNANDSVSIILSDTKNFKDTIQVLMSNLINAGKNNTKAQTESDSIISFLTNINSEKKLHYLENLMFEFKSPLKEVRSEKILLITEKDTLQLRLKNEDKAERKWKSANKFHTDTTYKLLIRDSAFCDVFNRYNKSQELTFTPQEAEYYGNIKLSVKGLKSNEYYIVQLLDEKQNHVRQIYSNNINSITLEYLNPGKYYIRIIEDLDKNKRWTSGHFTSKKQPERVYLYHKGINIKSGWDFELEWDLDGDNKN